ncbi:MAG: MmcQ/YjbR family DNA-binding protein, partial [Clostridia bacterium]|nr:MmcQ/YjbR family DNA-binding protein [Clostridia bacterium]
IYAKEIIKYIRGKYGDELEFLWEKFDDNAIWRRKDNSKWYALILKVSRRKLGVDSDETVEIIDLRVDPKETQTLIDNKRYYPAYHMNKKSWITICLDGSLDMEEICKRIDVSYDLAFKKR